MEVRSPAVLAEGAVCVTGDDAEATLLERAAAGDEHAVRALYRAHAARIHRRVARILSPADPDVEDVVQNVFIAALAAAHRFDHRSTVATWLLGIATRRALDQARARWRRDRLKRLGEWVGLGRAPESPEHRAAALDQAQMALARLSPEQRVVFVLHDVEGHTFQEIREMTGTGISTLHARLRAARRRLDALVEQWDGEESHSEAALAQRGGEHG